MTKTIGNQRPSPCQGCSDRYPACSDHCQKPEYLANKAEKEKIREHRKNYRASAWVRREGYVGRKVC